jgi:squalene-hopene/tetraprenyl-beta-curcumene cyclase
MIPLVALSLQTGITGSDTLGIDQIPIHCTRNQTMRRILPLLALIAALPFGCARTETKTAVVVQEEAIASTQVGDIVPTPREVPRRSSDEALATGVAYLLSEQSDDGSWRSDLYATFKDGLALTPLVVSALQEAAAVGVEPAGAAVARRKGIEFLARFAKAGGTIDPGPDGIDYPVYTAAMTVKVLSHPDGKDFKPARDGWVKYLKERQLTARLGWKEEEKQFGGWGYCRVIPQKPKPNEFAPNLIESNLSATLFALDALKAAGELDADTAKAAAVYVRTCQNWSPPPKIGVDLPWLHFLDGGFHFIYDDPVRNKAGIISKEEAKLPEEFQPNNWPLLFHSYGSTTADGLRALDLCGTREDQQRKLAAIVWLTLNFRPDTHPGIYVKPHEPNREAVYYYYAASVSRVMRDHDIKPKNGTEWASSLANELAGRQRRNGRWENPVELVRENEPLVATSNAVIALARCKK